MFFKYLRLVSGRRCGSWFLTKVSRGARFFTVVVHAYTKSLNRQGIQKNCVPEFPEYMNTYIITEGSNFKTFSKENDAIALVSCYLLTRKMLNVELNMILIVLMEFAYIRYSETLQQIWWIPCNMLIYLTVC